MFDVEKTKENLLDIMENIEENKDKKDMDSLYPFIINNQDFLMDSENLNKYYDTINDIMENNPIRTNFEIDSVMDKILDIISYSIEQPKDKLADFIKDELLKLKSEFKSEIKDWVFLFPIYNLKIENNISIGNVKFFKFDDKLASDLKYKYALDEFIEKNYITSPIGTVYAQTKVRGVKKPAFDNALYKIRLVINSLKLYISPKSSQFGLLGELPSYQYRISFNIDENRDWESNKELIERPSNFILDKSFIKEYKLNLLDKILSKSMPTDFEKRLLIAIYWFGEAMTVPIFQTQTYGIKEYKQDNLEYFKLGERIIKLFTALESILLEDNERDKTNKLSKRGALLLTYNKKIYKKYLSNFKALYWVRGEIVHRGDTFVFQKELEVLTDYTRNILQYLIYLNDTNKFENIHELIQYIETMELK